MILISNKEGKIFTTLVGGLYRKPIFDQLQNGEKVYLEREPDNRSDAHAIKVLNKDLQMIGYIANRPETAINNTMRATKMVKLGLVNQRISATSVSIIYSRGKALLCLDSANNSFLNSFTETEF